MAQTLVARLRHEPDPTKGSRFIATAAPVASDEAARQVLEGLRSEMPDATHHCAAWRLATHSIERALDDGEPSGSAGRPILAQLTGRDLVDVVVVVTRFFGGTKLGVGGLVRAYGGAAASVLDRAEVVPRLETSTLDLKYAYADGPAVERALARLGVEGGEGTFGAMVQRTVTVAVAQRDTVEQALRDATAGRIILPGGSQ